MSTQVLPPNLIDPANHAGCPRTIGRILESMRRDGWIGRPIVVAPDRRRYRGLTGSHRLRCAAELGLDVPALVTAAPWSEVCWRWRGLYYCPLAGVLNALGDAEAADLLRAEYRESYRERCNCWACASLR